VALGRVLLDPTRSGTATFIARIRRPALSVAGVAVVPPPVNPLRGFPSLRSVTDAGPLAKARLRGRSSDQQREQRRLGRFGSKSSSRRLRAGTDAMASQRRLT
jgi:hypothetical protein